ncbi:MAG: PP2C family protein-serine/threonine phosphatase [Oscillospiraceae bacterium]
MDKFSVVVNGLGNVAVGCVQHQGAREQQEDSVGFTPVNGDPMDGFLAVVADGMGGMASGAFVSGWTVRRMLEAEIGRSGEAPEKELCEAARRISGEIAAGGSRGGSTMAAVYLDGAGVHICSVGDSRVYMQRGGVLTRLTEDGDYMSNLLDRVIGGELTFQQAADDPERDSLTQFMGGGVNIQPTPHGADTSGIRRQAADMQRRRVQRRKRADVAPVADAERSRCRGYSGRVLAKGYANQDNLTAAVLSSVK